MLKHVFLTALFASTLLDDQICNSKDRRKFHAFTLSATIITNHITAKTHLILPWPTSKMNSSSSSIGAFLSRSFSLTISGKEDTY
jgi:hypothetical protein